jgi:hypothetical protein
VGMRVYDVLRMHGEEMLPRVAWRELAAAMATALRGSLTERLQIVFELFDVHATGHIEVPQLMSMASMLFKLRLLDPAAAERPVTSSRRERRASMRFSRIDGKRNARPNTVNRPTSTRPSLSSSRQRARTISSLPSPARQEKDGAVTRGSESSNDRDSERPSLDMALGDDDTLAPETPALPGSSVTEGRSDGDQGEEPRARSTWDARSDVADGLSAARDSTRISSASVGERLTVPGADELAYSACRAMCRATAPVTPATRDASPHHIHTGLPRASDPLGNRTGGRRRSLEAGTAASSLPRLRRVATVCGGDRFEFVQQQANDFLQLLLVMDVRRSGRLSYEEWVRGVLAMPEVLACFQLAIAPLPAKPASAAGARDGELVRGFGRVPMPSPVPHPPSTLARATDEAVNGSLWWRSLWRSFSATLTCSAGPP